MKNLLIISFVAFILSFTSAFGCESNLDCNLGSQCMKEGFALYGVCMGGWSPGNSYDAIPVHRENGGNTGVSCQQDWDCNGGTRCLKSAFQINGVCY